MIAAEEHEARGVATGLRVVGRRRGGFCALRLVLVLGSLCFFLGFFLRLLLGFFLRLLLGFFLRLLLGFFLRLLLRLLLGFLLRLLWLNFFLGFGFRLGLGLLLLFLGGERMQLCLPSPSSVPPSSLPPPSSPSLAGKHAVSRFLPMINGPTHPNSANLL